MCVLILCIKRERLRTFSFTQNTCRKGRGGGRGVFSEQEEREGLLLSLKVTAVKR